MIGMKIYIEQEQTARPIRENERLHVYKYYLVILPYVLLTALQWFSIIMHSPLLYARKPLFDPELFDFKSGNSSIFLSMYFTTNYPKILLHSLN